MINYTERIDQLMADVVVRVPTLSFIDMSRVLVFARAGRSDAEGPTPPATASPFHRASPAITTGAIDGLARSHVDPSGSSRNLPS